MAMTIAIFQLFVSIALLLASCELAGRISIGFEDLNDTVNKFEWYLFPLVIQRALPVVMINAQQRIGFECFGSIIVHRDTFKSVSYFYLL